MADPYIDDVVLLANFVGSDGATSYTPEIGDTVDFYADAELQTTTTQFGNSTAHVDGTGDYLDTGAAGDFDFIHTNDEDFTIEMWVRLPTVSSDGYILTTRTNSYGFILGIEAGGKLFFQIYDNVAARVDCTETGTSIAVDTWYYISVTRSGGTGTGSYELKLDNVSKATDTYATVETGTHLGLLTFGKTATAASSFREIQAYIGPTRITQGVARTISGVPTDIFEGGTDDYFYNVLSLLNFADMGDGTTITDTAPGTPLLSWFANNGATITSGVMELDGVNDYVAASDDADFREEFDGTNSSSWTIEIKYKVGSISSFQPVIDWRSSVAQVGMVLFQPGSGSDEINFVAGDSTVGWDAVITSIGIDLSVNDIAELAVTRNGSDYLLHVNGIYIGKDTTAVAPLSLGTAGVRIGRQAPDGSSYATIDIYRARFTKDTARYSEVDYAPPPGFRYPEPPFITTQPSAEQVVEDTTATFTVVADGAVSYQWFETTAGLLSGETATTLDFTAVIGDDGNSYYVEITNTDGTISSDTVLLTVLPELDAYLELTGPLGTPSFVVFNNFSEVITDTRELYEMDITGTPTLTLPISSWQATVQSDQANYAQCVIPNVDEYTSEITTRQGTEEFVIYKTTEINEIQERSEMVRAPVETVSFAQGAFNSSATMQGYTDPVAATTSPKTRTLTDIRTDNTSASGKRRIRCTIDWFLIPGDTASTPTGDFTAVYINYFVSSSGDIYMDVGDR